MQRLEFHISYECSNSCFFCSENDQLEKINKAFIPKKAIIDKLKEYRERGFNHVTFTGGEPTLHPDFLLILREAKYLGYTTYCTSNGVRLSSKVFAEKVFPFLNEICFSVHGFDAASHNFHTKNSHSFAGIQRALKNMCDFGKDSFGMVNTIVTPYNVEYLEKILSFASGYKCVKHILFSLVAPEGKGLDNYGSLGFALNTISKKIPALVMAAKRKSLVLRFFGLPMCVLSSFYRFSNDAHWSARATIELSRNRDGEFFKVTRSYKPVRNRIKVYRCRACAVKNICGGIFKEYADRFGTEGLTPFSLNIKA